MTADQDVVEFELGGELFALDIMLAREIVEMMPITPIPGAPPHIAGIINLRGEITTVIGLEKVIGVQATRTMADRKIIVLMSGATRGKNVGFIVDDVRSVIPAAGVDAHMVAERDLSAYSNSYVKGIIRHGEESGSTLVMWLDVSRILAEAI
ncbi:chemotaxis protein CheW [uncultured Methanofollis sp.]|uniref:chemotaxis protein CheW n=1 Tax=uncultured Methanofollis sp. TaxID=262500 RepID=UPI002621C21D|nr:chemotaxis protein CheW [uncultured Methanofollis sp.]